MHAVAKRSAAYFAASLVAMAASIATLPLATRILGPEDYGTYAILVTGSITIQAFANGVYIYLLPAHLGSIQGSERRDLIFTSLINAFVATTVLSGLAAIIAEMNQGMLTAVGLDGPILFLTIAATILVTPWLLCTELLAIEGRAVEFAAITILQSAVIAVSLLGCLFVLKLGSTSLYVSLLAGNAAAGLASTVLLRHDFRGCYRRHWLIETRRFAPAAIGQRLAEAGSVLLERTVIAASSSVRDVGLYTHAQMYSSATSSMLNVMSRGMLPLNLEEARADPPQFTGTRAFWLPVQLLVVLVATGFALVGDVVIDLLTNGKFTDAQPMAYVLLVAVALQTGSKAETSYLMARGLGNKLANLNTMSIGISLAALLILVPLFGAMGAAAAIVLRTAAFRIGLGLTGRQYKVPFQDTPLLAGLAGSAVVAAAVFWFGMPSQWRVVGIVAVGAGAVVLVWQIFKTLLFKAEPGYL